MDASSVVNKLENIKHLPLLPQQSYAVIFLFRSSFIKTRRDASQANMVVCGGGVREHARTLCCTPGPSGILYAQPYGHVYVLPCMFMRPKYLV